MVRDGGSVRMIGSIDFILKASGLYVPPLIGLAVNPLGRFQPCNDCCGPDDCGGCTVPTPSDFLATIAGVGNVGCPTCEDDLNKTFFLERYATCFWRSDTFYIAEGSGGVCEHLVRLLAGAIQNRFEVALVLIEPLSVIKRWEKSWYPQPVPCKDLQDENIPGFSSTFAYCYLSAATCHITAA